MLKEQRKQTERMVLNMKRKFLEDMGLEKEQVDKILDENSQDIGKAKGDSEKIQKDLDAANAEVESLKGQISDRDKQLETLKNSTGDVEGMKQEIAKLQADNKAKDDAHAAEIKQLKIDAAIDSALTGAKAKNNTAVKALLKDLDKAELAEDGTIKGLAEQIEALQKSDAYLFDTTTKKQTQVKGAKPGESGNEDGDHGVDTSKMTYSELAAYMAEHPDAKID
jgi:chromosome segregation ATPase|uniref:Minor structural protein n=2 Tax=root TaxID=1 RepID=A0A8S5LCH5_9CAUD|nr:MAG TPA: minor structural protein [Siphoviridae sp. ctYKh4]